MAELREGQMAPRFGLPADDGAFVRLAELRGKFVILFFYPKDDTQTCTAEAIAFSALAPAYDSAGAIVLGISPDPVDRHEAYKRKHSLSVRLLSDGDRSVARRYGVWGEKIMFGRRYDGVVRTTFLIDATGRIARIWRNVRVRGHAEAVLEATTSASAGRQGRGRNFS